MWSRHSSRKKRNLPDYTRKIYIIVPNHTIGSNRQGANLKRKHNAYHDESPDHWYDPPFWSKVWGLIPDLIQGENGFIQLLSRIIPYFIPDKSKFYPRSDPYFTPDLIHILSRIIIYFIPDFSLNFTADHITSITFSSCDFSYRKSGSRIFLYRIF